MKVERLRVCVYFMSVRVQYVNKEDEEAYNFFCGNLVGQSSQCLMDMTVLVLVQNLG